MARRCRRLEWQRWGLAVVRLVRAMWQAEGHMVVQRSWREVGVSGGSQVCSRDVRGGPGRPSTKVH